MSSVEYFREFVNERLTAAVEEIFGVFKNIIFEYEEKILRQSSQLDVRQHEINGMELPQQHVWKEENVISDQQLCNQENSSSMDQEDPQSPQMKEEQDELDISQEGEQLVVKQETDAFVLTPTYEESDHGESQTLYLNSDESLSAAYKDSVVNMPVTCSVVVEPNSNQQLRSNNSDVAERRDQRGDKRKNDFKIKPKYDFKMNGGERAYVCKICGKVFRHYSHLEAHIRIHTGEKPYVCKICGKNFRQIGQLRQHVSVHTGEKPYLCKTCGKDFRLKSHLKVHMRTHTREKPLLCKS